MRKWITLDGSNSYEETGAHLVSAETENANKKMTAVKNESRDVQEVIYEILMEAHREVERGRKWNSTPEVWEIEKEINRTFAEVIAGEKTVDDVRAICRRWKEAGTR